MLAGSPHPLLSSCNHCLVGLPSQRRAARSSHTPAASSDRREPELAPAEQRSSSALGGPPAGSQRTCTAAALNSDPEAKFRQYGEHYGGSHTVPDLSDWMHGAPRVRLRRPVDRQRAQLADLAVLNDRLAGRAGWQIRQRVEFLRTRRRNWEQIYQQLACNDTATTLAMIEEANWKVTSSQLPSAMTFKTPNGGSRSWASLPAGACQGYIYSILSFP